MLRVPLSLVVLAFLPLRAVAQETVERHLSSMGTYVSLDVTAPTRAEALAASEAAVRALEAVEARLSTWRDDSELARLNAAPIGAPFALSPELAHDLERARDLWRATDGTFDPGVGALVRAYGLREGGRTPTAEERAEALATGGFGSLSLKDGVAVRLRPGLVLEEGGFGKGIGLDAALDALRAAGATSAVIDLGGQLAILEQDAAAPGSYAVAHPRDRARPVLELALASGSLSTSGNSERGITVDGQRAGHILDPRSGEPAGDFGSVTVWAESGLDADALSTALFVLGPDAGLDWAAAHPGVEALFLVAGDDGALTARATAGFAERLTVLDPALTLTRSDAPLAVIEASAASAPVAGGPLGAQPTQNPDDTEERLSRLEHQVDALGYEVERTTLGDVVVPVGESYNGLGPAASKVYSKDQGLSIGGYGEGLYRTFSGDEPAEWDMLRAVFYFGYKFNENWVLNTEVEFEHGGEEVGIEFAYLDYLNWEHVKVRAGNVLVPMGFLNELHEPTTYLGALRPDTERFLIPSTWHENGVGIYGDLGPFDYRMYVVNGFDATGFSAEEGLREGRQGGSEALAEDLALVGRLDFVNVPGLIVGGSAYAGDSGQDQAGIPDSGTTIYELHGEWKANGLWLRALAARADVDDVEELNTALGLTGADSIGEQLEGFYGEVGYDVMGLFDSESSVQISPYARYESLDTQAEVPSGFSSDPANDEETQSYGIFVSPIAPLVFKVEYQDRDQGVDGVNVLMGYVF